MTTSAGPTQPFRLRSLTASVYLPTILFSIGEGAVIPVIPLLAIHLGASLAEASLIVALRGLGQLVFDIPAGLAVSKWGDEGAMVLGTLFVGIVAVGAAFSPSPAALGLLMFVMGGGWAFWQIARLAYVSEIAPLHERGRALSMLGGMSRIGNFMGPLLGGLLAVRFGLESAFIVQALMGLAAAGVMFLLAKRPVTSERIEVAGLQSRLVGTLIDHRAIFLRAAIPLISLAVVRQARQVFLPLWGDQIGLDVAQIGLLTSVSFFIDAAVFYPSGAIMDRFGRKWAGVPCLGVIAVGLILLPLTSSFYSFMLIAALTGVGNGFGSGINQTLGADFAPEDRRGEFLGLWRLIGDAGQAVGPSIIGLLTGIASLGVAAVSSGGIGLVGAVAMMALIPEPLRRGATPRPGEPAEPSTGPPPG